MRTFGQQAAYVVTHPGAFAVCVLRAFRANQGLLLAGALLYLLGVTGEILVLASIYLVMPVGRPSWRHALVGAVTATALWEITRHLGADSRKTLAGIGNVHGAIGPIEMARIASEATQSAHDASTLRCDAIRVS